MWNRIKRKEIDICTKGNVWIGNKYCDNLKGGGFNGIWIKRKSKAEMCAQANTIRDGSWWSNKINKTKNTTFQLGKMEKVELTEFKFTHDMVIEKKTATQSEHIKLRTEKDR